MTSEPEAIPSPTDKDVVWHQAIDGGVYTAVVIYRDPDDARFGIFRVWETETQTLLHKTPVGITYGALFGPSDEDVTDWQYWALDAIDNPETRVIWTPEHA